MKNKTSIEEKNSFLKLLTRSALTPSLDLEKVYQLSQNDIVLLPMATNNMVGAICIKVIEYSHKTVATNSLSDFNYYDYFRRSLFKVCKYFIILRHLQSGEGGHFDYFLGQRTHTGIFQCNSVEAEYVLSLCNKKYRFCLTGERKVEQTKNLSLLEWVKNMSKEDSNETVYKCRFPTEVIEWFDLAYNFPLNNIPKNFFTLSVDEKKIHGQK